MENMEEYCIEKVQLLLEKMDEFENSIAEQIITKRFELVDGFGKTRGWIATNEDGDAEIVLQDDIGQSRIRMFCKENGYSGVYLFGPQSEILARLEIQDSNIPRLVLVRPDAESEIKAQIGLDNTAEICLSQKKTEKSISLVLENGRDPYVVVTDINNVRIRYPE